MRINKYILVSLILSVFPLSCYSQNSSNSIVKEWSKCEIEIELNSLKVPPITHFKIIKVDDHLIFNNEGVDLNNLQKNHFREVLVCLNEKFIETFPDSVEIIHIFNENQRPPSPEINGQLIAKYKKKHRLKDDVIVIFSGTSNSLH